MFFTPAKALPDNPNARINYEGKPLAEIVLAGGCFWGTDAYLTRVPGVASLECGYANGTVPNPDYRLVCTGTTGYAEAVKVEYDPKLLPLPKLLDQFFETINPTTLNRQGNDVGSQYRSGIYYLNPEDAPVIRDFLATAQAKYSKPIVTEVAPLSSYYRAEDYHQDYLEKNPGGYCHVDLSKLAKHAA